MGPLLLTDSTMPVSFCRAGIGPARAMANFLGDRTHLVEDVLAELERLAGGLPALAALLEGWPSTPARQLDLNLKADVAVALKARQISGGHPDEDKGEIATVFFAEHRRGLGEEFTIATDDSYGKRLASDRGFEILTTPALALQMICAEALSEADGKRVWQRSTSRSRWKEFGPALDRERMRV